jgi:hypothetical protein
MRTIGSVERGKTICCHGGIVKFGFVKGPPAYVEGGHVDSSLCRRQWR